MFLSITSSARRCKPLGGGDSEKITGSVDRLLGFGSKPRVFKIFLLVVLQ